MKKLMKFESLYVGTRFEYCGGIYLKVDATHAKCERTENVHLFFAKSGCIADDGFPVRQNVTEVTYHRPPTSGEIKFGNGATHYRTFPVDEAFKPGTRVLKAWFVADDGLRYYR